MGGIDIKSRIIFAILIFFVLVSLACVSAADDNQTDEMALESDAVTQEILTDTNDDTGSFTDLEDFLSQDETLFKLEKDYAFNSSYDQTTSGIRVLRDNAVIDGQNHKIDGKGLAKIFRVEAKNVTIKNINFVNGLATGAMSGGAIRSFNYIVIENCNFTNNKAENCYGGALYLDKGGNITNSNFKDCSADLYGGAIIFVDEGFVKNCNFTNSTSQVGGAIYFNSKGTIESSNFIDNKCNLNSNSVGGAVYFTSKGLVNGSTFKNNRAIRNGGAIHFANAAEGTVENSVFDGNGANYLGGAIYFDDSNHNGIVKNCNFTGNKIDSQGGAIYCAAKNLTVIGSNFNNQYSGGGSGAIYFKNYGEIYTSTFTNISSSGHGAAVYFNMFGKVVASNFTNNHVTSTGNMGGAIYLNDGGLLKDSNFKNNTAVYQGGAVFARDSNKTVNVVNCNFENNNISANYYYLDGRGGAIYLAAIADISDSTFIYNEANQGGAIYTNRNLTVRNSVFLNNKAISDILDYNIFDQSVVMKGHEKYVNAIYLDPPSVELVMKNVTFWNGEIVNTDDIYPKEEFAACGVNVTLEIYDENSHNLVVNVTLVTDINGSAKYDPYHLNDGLYGYKVYHIEDNYYTSSEIFGGMFTIYRNSSSVEININDMEEFLYNASNIGFTVVNRTTVRVVITNSTGSVLFNQTTEENYVLADVFPNDDYYTITVYNEGNENYSSSNASKLFKILKAGSKIAIDPFNNYTYGNDATIIVSGENLTVVNVTVWDGDKNIVFSENITGNSVNVSLLPVGKYNVTAYNYGSEGFNPSQDSRLFEVLKANSSIVITPIGDEIYGTGILVEYTGENLTVVNVTVYNADKKIVFSENVTGGQSFLPILAAGQYNVTAVNYGDENHNPSNHSATFNILKRENHVEAVAENVLYGEKTVIQILYQAPGNYIIDISGNVTVMGLEEEPCLIELYLPSGDYYVNVTYEDDENYTTTSVNATFKVYKLLIEADNANYGWAKDYLYQAKFIDELGNPLSNRTLKFVIAGKTLNATTDGNGTANVTLNLDVGTYDILISNELADSNQTKKINILPRIAENKNLVMDYDTDKFKVKAIGDDGNPVKAGETVKMVVNGVTYNVKTDKNGYATLPIELKPKTYTITSTYKGYTVKNKINVKHVLKTKAVKFKKSSKKLVLKATLKLSNGKALAGKKVTFIFKGKKYTVKTNKKGIAQKKIPKKVIKKLKAGKKYKFSVSYKNDTCKSTVKVRK